VACPEHGGPLITVAVSIFVGRYRQTQLNHSTGTQKRRRFAFGSLVPLLRSGPHRKAGRMRRYLIFTLIVTPILAASACDEDSPTSPSGPSLSFFVTSATSATGNLGGLAGADATCQRLAAAAGQGSRTWRAYLSVERDPANGNQPTNARDRIGAGPWYNASLAIVANNLAELHSRTGDAAVFVDERGQRINGQWTGSPTPIQHDILTGSNADGTLLAGMTCSDWTSDSAAVSAQVGHSDGMGPNQSTAGALSSWNSSHASLNCADTAPRGGAGRFYCFAR
jgi:hypothetical protein